MESLGGFGRDILNGAAPPGLGKSVVEPGFWAKLLPRSAVFSEKSVCHANPLRKSFPLRPRNFGRKSAGGLCAGIAGLFQEAGPSAPKLASFEIGLKPLQFRFGHVTHSGREIARRPVAAQDLHQVNQPLPHLYQVLHLVCQGPPGIIQTKKTVHEGAPRRIGLISGCDFLEGFVYDIVKEKLLFVFVH